MQLWQISKWTFFYPDDFILEWPAGNIPFNSISDFSINPRLCRIFFFCSVLYQHVDLMDSFTSKLLWFVNLCALQGIFYAILDVRDCLCPGNIYLSSLSSSTAPLPECNQLNLHWFGWLEYQINSFFPIIKDVQLASFLLIIQVKLMKGLGNEEELFWLTSNSVKR